MASTRERARARARAKAKAAQMQVVEEPTPALPQASIIPQQAVPEMERVRGVVNPRGGGIFGQRLLDSLIGMGKEIPGDIKELGAAYGQLLEHPIQSAQQLANIPLGALEMLIPGEQKHEEAARAVGRHFAGYLDPKEFTRRSAKDPLKTLLDLSPFLGAKGLKAASYIDPLSVAAKTGKAGSKEILERLGGKFVEERLMASALKTGGPLRKHKKDIELALKREIGTTEKRTLEPMKKRLDEVLKEVDSNIAASAGKGETVDLSKIIEAGYNQEIGKRKYDLTGAKDVEALIKERDVVLEKHGKVVPIDEALKFRRTTDKSLSRMWSRAEKSGSSVFETVASHDASKNVTNLLRDRLNKYSTNAALNKEASELLTLIPHVEKRIVQGRSKNVIPIGSGEGIAAIKAFGGDVTSAGLVLTAAKLAEASPVKAAAARGIRATRTGAPTKVGKYQALTQAALRNQQMQEQATRERKTFR